MFYKWHTQIVSKFTCNMCTYIYITQKSLKVIKIVGNFASNRSDNWTNTVFSISVNLME